MELPDEFMELNYSNLLCGVIRGALQLVNVKVSCEILRDSLKGGGDATEVSTVTILSFFDHHDNMYAPI